MLLLISRWAREKNIPGYSSLPDCWQGPDGHRYTVSMRDDPRRITITREEHQFKRDNAMEMIRKHEKILGDAKRTIDVLRGESRKHEASYNRYKGDGSVEFTYSKQTQLDAAIALFDEKEAEIQKLWDFVKSCGTDISEVPADLAGITLIVEAE